MSRLIDADKLVKDFEKAKEGCKHLHELLFFDGVMAIVDNQLTVGGWIPVSERLPEKTGAYLVTNNTGNVAKVMYVSEKDHPYAGWAVMSWIEVLAWQPLPEPYNPELLKEGD